MIEIRTFRPEHASVAAQLHIEGQPGTFLTSMGDEFLTAFYAQLAVSDNGIGFVAVQGDKTVGVVVGTMSTSALFKELIIRRGLFLIWPVFKRLITKPSLIPMVIQTLLYPAKAQAKPAEAEMLYMGVTSDVRRQGIGTRIFEEMAWACQQRGAKLLELTVDASNTRAQNMYVKYGWEKAEEFQIYGRTMIIWHLDLTTYQYTSLPDRNVDHARDAAGS